MGYEAARALAARLIAAKGRPITILPPVAGPADPDAPWNGAADQTIAEPNARGVFLDFRKDGGMFRSERTGSLKFDTIEARDKRLIVAAEGTAVTPNTGCRIVDSDGRRYKVVEVLKQLEPGDAVILWELQVRA